MLADRLIAEGRPLLDRQLRHPTVVGIGNGTLDDAIFRVWLEQDYLFLLDYVRVFARLAWQAPPPHLGTLVDLAYATWHDELTMHRSLAAEFEADLDGATKGTACAEYTAFLLESASDYGLGLAALLPCMWGYSTLGQSMPRPSNDNRYARWVDTYADPAFGALAQRCAEMLDDAAPPFELARACFLTAMDHELRFWNVG